MEAIGSSTPDGDAGDADSFWAPADDMDSGNTDPTVLSLVASRTMAQGRINAEGAITLNPDFTDPNADTSYDWYRNGITGGQRK